MMAVAEEAQRRFRIELEAALAPVPAGDPLARFRALGLGYLRWAMQNPAHFEVISNGRLFDHDGAATVSRDNSELIAMAGRLPAGAFAKGALRVGDPKQGQIAGRALVYGFARMNIDGHFPRWGVADAERTAGGGYRPLHRRRRPEVKAQQIHRALRPRRQIHCVFMTTKLRFYDMPQSPDAASASWSPPAKA